MEVDENAKSVPEKEVENEEEEHIVALKEDQVRIFQSIDLITSFSIQIRLNISSLKKK